MWLYLWGGFFDIQFPLLGNPMVKLFYIIIFNTVRNYKVNSDHFQTNNKFIVQFKSILIFNSPYFLQMFAFQQFSKSVSMWWTDKFVLYPNILMCFLHFPIRILNCLGRSYEFLVLFSKWLFKNNMCVYSKFFKKTDHFNLKLI